MQANRRTQHFPASESSSTPQPSETKPPHRILVVDTDPYICHLSADVLIRHGYEVPKLTGVELVRKVRAAHMAP